MGGTQYTSLYHRPVAEHPEIDPTVAASGQSLGGITSTRAGLFQPEHKFSAVAAIFWQGTGRPWRGCSAPSKTT